MLNHMRNNHNKINNNFNNHRMNYFKNKNIFNSKIKLNQNKISWQIINKN